MTILPLAPTSSCFFLSGFILNLSAKIEANSVGFFMCTVPTILMSGFPSRRAGMVLTTSLSNQQSKYTIFESLVRNTSAYGSFLGLFASQFPTESRTRPPPEKPASVIAVLFLSIFGKVLFNDLKRPFTDLEKKFRVITVLERERTPSGL